MRTRYADHMSTSPLKWLDNRYVKVDMMPAVRWQALTVKMLLDEDIIILKKL